MVGLNHQPEIVFLGNMFFTEGRSSAALAGGNDQSGNDPRRTAAQHAGPAAATQSRCGGGGGRGTGYPLVNKHNFGKSQF